MTRPGSCPGKCKEQLGKLTFPNGRWSDGLSRCTNCEVWLDWRFCHLPKNKKANSESKGMRCNCCNTQVRQRPRSKRSKEINQATENHKIQNLTNEEKIKLELNKLKSELGKNKRTQNWDIETSEEIPIIETSGEIPIIDTKKRLSEIRDHFESKYADDDVILKQFRMLENYLKILPNKKNYNNVNDFLS